MDVVVTHDMSDFDAFASCVAAERLYPGATIVLGRTLGKPLRRFLALHEDRFATIRYSELDAERVTRLIVVDVRRRSRLGAFAPVLARADRGEVEVHVWDHHAASEDDLQATHEVVEPVGSATTLLVEEIRRRGLSVDPIEATLYALGIHQDTGSLTYGGTTARDAHAVAWLLERGASLAVINRYLHQPFSAEQRKALRALIDAVEIQEVAGVDVAFSVIALEHAIDGLDEVTSQAIELGGYSALFALYALDRGRVQVVARARRPFVDVGRVVKSVGGGGHRPAASAIVKKADVARVREALLEALRAAPPRPTRVCDVMSSPVHTAAHDVTLAELRRSLAAWGISGVPVMRDGALAGIVSRRDVERAERDDALDLPVSGRMTHRVRTIEVDATLEDALARMTDHEVGRLPVLRRGQLVGILTRSDVLRFMY